MKPIAVVVASLFALTFSSAADQRGGDGIPVDHWQMRDIDHVSADGAAISRPDFKESDWYQAVVPGTILTTLVKAGVYPEPLYGENNRAIPESLCRTSYWYRTVTPIPAAMRGNDRHVWLNFDGINYAAEIWVNGRHVGDMKGAFTRGKFDITPELGPGEKTAAIAVHILPPLHPSYPLEQTIAAGTGPNGGAMGADGPTFLATVGWDWIPGIRDRDMGIWEKVRLTSTGPVAIEDPYVTTTALSPNHEKATIVIQTTLRNATNHVITGKVTFLIGGAMPAVSIPYSVPPGEPTLVKSGSIEVSKPKLWWPNGYGPQNLYTLKTEVVADRISTDHQSTSFGIRTIKYFPDNGPHNLTIIVNDAPVFCKGGNWGMDEAMKRSPRSRLEAQMRLHKDANFTMIRNWVGMATQADFYDMCDKYGILVWDDFWLANPVDGPNPLDPDLFLANAKEKILRFRNHPSIAVWCGRNEGNPPAPINAGLAGMIASLDGERFYQPHSSSANGVGGGGPYSYHKPADYFTFRDAFHTEVGGPSIPTLEAIEAMMPKKDWWPINDDWAEHDLCRGAQRGDDWPLMLGRRFGPVTGLEDFVRKSQLATYESYRGIFEGREAQAFKPATGVLLWMSNPCQPSFVWQIYDYDLEPTAALFASRKGCEPIHVMMDPRDNRVILVNNTPNALGNVTAKADIYDVSGTLLKSQEGSVDGAPSGAAPVFILDVADPRIGSVYFVKLSLRDTRRQILSDNFYWYARPDAANAYTPNDFSAMQAMPAVALDARARRDDGSRGFARIAVTLRNPSRAIALMAHLQLRRAKSGERVLPTYYSDNYISLVPGEERTIQIEAATADLAGEEPSVVLDGWNVRAAEAEGDDVRVTTNTAAIPRQPPILRTPVAAGGVFERSLAAGDLAPYSRDEDFADGGFVRGQNVKVDLSGLRVPAAPMTAYQTPRSGEFAYTIPMPIGTYRVRIHFADLTSTAADSRQFNIEINGKVVATDFDIFATAGARAKAVTRDFENVQPNSAGNIVIAFKRGSAGFPLVNAIQILRP